MRHIILLALLAILCNSCSGTVAPAAPAPAVARPTPVALTVTPMVVGTATPDHSLTATADWARFQATMAAIETQGALISNRPTTMPTLPWQPLEISGEIPNCSPAAPNENIEIPGTILYQDWEGKGLYAAGGKTFDTEKTIIPPVQKLFVFGVSPDGNWIAYSPEPKDNDHSLEKVDPVIVLIGADGKRIEKTQNMAWPKKVDDGDYELVSFVDGYWLNNHLIFAYINSKIPEGTPSPLLSPQIGKYLPILFDPFTGDVQTTLLDGFMPTNGLTAYNISPELKHILVYDFLGSISLRNVDDAGSMITLWDISLGPAFIPVRWSPNGEWVVFPTYTFADSMVFKTALLNKNGQELVFENPIFEGLVITDSSWSPDSRYFAFLDYKNESLSDLFVFDVKNKKFVLSCPLASTFAHSPNELTWSPDSNWIAVSTYKEPVRMININNGLSKQLDLIGNVVGWSDKFTANP